MNSINAKNIIYFCILIVLSLPIIQQKTNYFDGHLLRPLNGSFESKQPILLTIENWFNGTYSKAQENYLNENFGFRNLFVRIHNQLYYTIFKEAKANDVIIGLNNYLYEKKYISAYLGQDYIGKKAIKDKVHRLQKVCDTLRSKNTEIIVVLAPGKGSFYPEYIPKFYHDFEKKITNYEGYSTELKNKKIHVLDFHKWFTSMKKTSPYPLFPKTGIHWSHYGEVLAADSLSKYINRITNTSQNSSIKIDKINLSDSMINWDDDIEKGMNLLCDINDLKMAHPTFSFVKSNSKSLKIITVADSYYFGMYRLGFCSDIYDGQFWYYNKQINPDNKIKSMVNKIDIKSNVEQSDVIILLATDAKLHEFAFGFIDQLYYTYFSNNLFGDEKLLFYIQTFFGYNKITAQEILDYIDTHISSNEEWVNSTQEKATKNGRNWNEQAIHEANYILSKNKELIIK